MARSPPAPPIARGDAATTASIQANLLPKGREAPEVKEDAGVGVQEQIGGLRHQVKPTARAIGKGSATSPRFPVSRRSRMAELDRRIEIYRASDPPDRATTSR